MMMNLNVEGFVQMITLSLTNLALLVQLYIISTQVIAVNLMTVATLQQLIAVLVLQQLVVV